MLSISKRGLYAWPAELNIVRALALLSVLKTSISLGCAFPTCRKASFPDSLGILFPLRETKAGGHAAVLPVRRRPIIRAASSAMITWRAESSMCLNSDKA